jgi:hypothetical protein
MPHRTVHASPRSSRTHPGSETRSAIDRDRPRGSKPTSVIISTNQPHCFIARRPSLRFLFPTGIRVPSIEGYFWGKQLIAPPRDRARIDAESAGERALASRRAAVEREQAQSAATRRRPRRKADDSHAGSHRCGRAPATVGPFSGLIGLVRPPALQELRQCQPGRHAGLCRRGFSRNHVTAVNPSLPSASR